MAEFAYPAPLASRRRHSHRVESWRGRTAFAKAASDAESAEDLRREATVLRLLHGRMPDCPAPRVLDWSDHAATLRVEHIAGLSLADEVRSAGILGMSAAHELGEALAMLHRGGRAILAEVGPAASGPVAVHRPTPSDMRRLSAGAMEVIVLTQRSAALCAALDRLCAPSHPETLIHGDLRFENVLVGGPSGLRLVDWEFAGTGEGAWDVAHAIAWCLSAWLSSVPQVPAVPPDRLLHAAALPLPIVRPVMTAMWRAYRREIRGSTEGLQRRCTELVAVRLVQLAVELADDTEDLRAVSVMHLQLAENLLADPVGGGRWLFGPQPDGASGER